jgi:hypothetical protein
MTPDKELIRMCDCEEVQSRFKPKVGDKIYTANDGEIHTVIKVLSGMRVALEVSFNAIYQAKNHTFIPRIEDVLEWLGDRFVQLRRINQLTRQVGHSGGCTFHKSTGVYDDLKTLLKAFMHLEHNKTWDGEQWK